jgi:pimeloyl-ACP methyl ester carboxylesterase
MGTFVLVHGAWHGGWCWERLAAELRGRGHTVVVMDLPVADGSATFLDYRDAVLEAWPDPPADDVVLVGHSLGAMVIPLVAAERRVQTSVFLCPLVPNPAGMPWEGLPQMGAAGAYATHVRDDGSETFDALEEAVFTFYGACDPADAARAFDHLRPQNSRSLWDRPYPLAALPPGRRAAIGGLHDRAITPEFLRAACPQRLGTDVVFMDSDHSPFMSAPEALADLLISGVE